MRLFAAVAALSIISCIGHDRLWISSDAELNAWHYPLREPDAIAHRIPGYGGHWYDQNQGRLNISLVDLNDSTAARAALLPMLIRQREALLPIAFHKGKYGLLQLDIWRCAIPKELNENFDGYVGSGIHQSSNRIRFTVTDDSAEKRLRTVMKKLGVPQGAVEFERGEPARFL